MKRLLPILFAFLSTSISAQNLVPNSSFESYGPCPSSISQFNNLNNWFSIPGHTGSTDFFHSCGGSLSGVPTNLFGVQAANTGNAYIGQYVGYLLTPYENYREYGEVQLTSPLVAGTTYLVEAYFSLPDRVEYSIDRYGFYFSSSQLTGSGQLVIPLNPQVESVGTFYNNTSGWDYFSGTFVATGGEQYLSIGNFRDYLTTNIIPSGVTGGGIGHPYLYVDDVTVTPFVVLNVAYTYLTAEYLDGENELHWKTTNEENITSFRIEHSLDGEVFAQLGEVPAGGLNGEYRFTTPGEEDQPNQYYRLKALDVDGSMHTSQIFVLKGEGTGSQVSAYPSFIRPGGTVTVEIAAQPGERVDYQLMDMTGKVLERDGYTLQNEFDRIGFTPRTTQSGAYVLQVIVGGEVENFRVMIR